MSSAEPSQRKTWSYCKEEMQNDANNWLVTTLVLTLLLLIKNRRWAHRNIASNSSILSIQGRGRLVLMPQGTSCRDSRLIFPSSSVCLEVQCLLVITLGRHRNSSNSRCMPRYKLYRHKCEMGWRRALPISKSTPMVPLPIRTC